MSALNVLVEPFINVLGKGLTPTACLGDRGSVWWAPADSKLKPAHEAKNIYIQGHTEL